MDKTENQFKGFEGRINKAFGGIAGGMGLNLGKLSKFALIGMAAKELYKFGKASIEVAADLTETQNVVDVTFGHMSDQVNNFSDNAIKQFGLSELAAKKYASTMGAMLKSSGIRGTAVKDMSIDLTKLSADMASFYNLDNDAAFKKIMSGMSGMTQPLKELGINMNITNLKAYALGQGIEKSWENMSQAEQTMIRYNYLLSVTGDSQGDFARNTNTWSNQVKLLRMQWEQFMSLIGKALTEILLPVVKFLNRMLELLINVTKEIGKIYTMITGKKATVEANNNIADSADDAADGEFDIADGIDKATKAAKKALAPFDELNILQNNLGSGGGGLGDIFSGGKGELNTNITTIQADNGLDESKKKWEGFFVWISDWWNRVKQTFAVPIMVPAPVFADLKNPIYKPNWGLIPPLIPAPVFEPIPRPVYEPNWNLDLPPIPQVVFPPIEHGAYDFSLEGIKVKTSEGLEWVKQKYNETSLTISQGLATAWSTIEGNYNKHKETLGVITEGMSIAVIANINEMLSKLGINANSTLEVTQNNWETWGANLVVVTAEAVKGLSKNMIAGFEATALNTINFANSQLGALKDWGSGVLSIAAETAIGFVNNMVSGFRTVWDNFKELMSSIGEKVKGFFSSNKDIIVKTAITAGVVVGAGALALTAPAIIPYAGAALGGLASIPALKTGGITDINNPLTAVVGDHPTQREVISPLDDLMDMITAAVSTTETSGGDLYLTIKIGEDTITDKLISNINRENRIKGETVITI